MYIVTSAWKTAAEAVYEEGEVGQPIDSEYSHMKGFQFGSLTDLSKKDCLPMKEGSWVIFDGRLECSVLEVEDGTEPCSSELKRWERGEIKMYSCTYSFIVKRIEEVDFDKMAKEFGIRNEVIS